MAANVIPYGVQDYKEIIDDKSLYIDKTRSIEALEQISHYNVFLRPRRFGKSLMTSVLQYYYDISYKDQFDYLFGNTYIGKNKTDEANSYMVMNFNFSGVDSRRDKLEKSFNDSVRAYLNDFIGRYNLGEEFPENKPANVMLRDCFVMARTKTDLPIFVLIDEYDQFANAVLSEDKALFIEITSKSGFVRSFYEVFKAFAGTTVKRIFITGVTPITLDCLTSGFNIATNISNELMFNEMIGFTDEEIRATLERFNLPYEVHIDVLTKYYNGYKFNDFAGKTVYNSNLVLFYLRHCMMNGRPPSNLADTSISSDLDKITGMFDIYDNEADKKEILEKIVSKEPVSAVLKQKFDKDVIKSRDDFVSMLYYLGFLTMTEEKLGRILFTTPNYTVEDTYFNYYLEYIAQKNGIRINTNEIKDFVEDLIVSAKYDKMKAFLEKHLRALSNRDYMNFDEKYVKIMLFVSLRMHSYYTVKSELEVEGGYIDLALLPNFINKLDNYYIIEFKYIKAEDAGNRELYESKRKDAIEQLDRYNTSEELARVPNLRKVAIIAVKDEVTIEEIP